jgi:multidrug efflux pump subunit AcrA (membrane-fusion protein)
MCIAGILVNLPAPAGGLATYTVSAHTEGTPFAASGTIEAVRQSTLGSQVSGRVTQVLVRNGDDVSPGQALIQIEAGDPRDTAIASDAAASGPQRVLSVPM